MRCCAREISLVGTIGTIRVSKRRIFLNRTWPIDAILKIRHILDINTERGTFVSYLYTRKIFRTFGDERY